MLSVSARTGPQFGFSNPLFSREIGKDHKQTNAKNEYISLQTKYKFKKKYGLYNKNMALSQPRINHQDYIVI